METISENRRARFDYEVLESFEAGIELKGFEVKSAKDGRMQLAGSYAVVRGRPTGRASHSAGNELWLLNAQIPAYQPKNAPADYDPGRTRRLLLHAAEIKRIAGQLKEKKASLVPLRAYLKKNLLKIELGLGRLKNKTDKREALKKQSARREMRREAL